MGSIASALTILIADFPSCSTGVRGARVRGARVVAVRSDRAHSIGAIFSSFRYAREEWEGPPYLDSRVRPRCASLAPDPSPARASNSSGNPTGDVAVELAGAVAAAAAAASAAHQARALAAVGSA